MANLSPQEVSSYEQDGFLAPVNVLSPDEAAKYRTQLETFEAEYQDHPVVGGKNFKQFAHLYLPFLDELIHHPAILSAVSSILGDDLLVWGTDFFIKAPETNSYVAWHQDLHYWGLDEADEITAWLALSPATLESGCMRFIPGSHRNRVGHVEKPQDGAMLSRGQELDVEIDESASVNAPLEPGQISLHHGLTFHASLPNRSPDRRIGFAIRYIKPSMQQIGGEKGVATLVQGEDRFGHFEHAPRPTGVATAENLEIWQRAMDIQNGINFREMKA